MKLFLRHSLWASAVVLGVDLFSYAAYIGYYMYEHQKYHRWADPISRVKADHRTLATALESYKIDHGAFPSPLPLHALGFDPALLKELGIEHLGTAPPALSTPVSYVATSSYADPHAPLPEPRPYIYFFEGDQWILISPGNDGVYDADPVNGGGGFANWTPDYVASVTYDPSNGGYSGGDIMRTAKGIVEPWFFEKGQATVDAPEAVQ